MNSLNKRLGMVAVFLSIVYLTFSFGRPNTIIGQNSKSKDIQRITLYFTDRYIPGFIHKYVYDTPKSFMKLLSKTPLVDVSLYSEPKQSVHKSIEIVDKNRLFIYSKCFPLSESVDIYTDVNIMMLIERRHRVDTLFLDGSIIPPVYGFAISPDGSVYRSDLLFKCVVEDIMARDTLWRGAFDRFIGY